VELMVEVEGPWAAHLVDGPAVSEADRLWAVGPIWREIRLAPMPPSAARGEHWVIVGGSGIPDDEPDVPPWPGEVSYQLVEVFEAFHPDVEVEFVAFYRWARAV
jgi:hypothetical protein